MIEGIILLVLVIVFVVYKVVKSQNKNADSVETSGNAAVKMAPASAVTQAAPVIQSGIEEETVAAIMAAISCLTDSATGVQYTVRSINRVKSERPAWCFAGMQQNTRPF